MTAKQEHSWWLICFFLFQFTLKGQAVCHFICLFAENVFNKGALSQLQMHFRNGHILQDGMLTSIFEVPKKKNVNKNIIKVKTKNNMVGFKFRIFEYFIKCAIKN